MLRHQVTAFALIVALAGVGAGFLPGHVAAQSARRALDTNTYIDVAKAVLPSVVNISIEPKEKLPDEADVDDQQKYDNLMEFFMEQQRQGGMSPFPFSVSGSGVVIRTQGRKGYVLTNNHVVAGVDSRSQIKLTFHQLGENTTEYNVTTDIVGESVKVIGQDSLSDLAVIEFEMPEGFSVNAIEFADSDKVEIGENVLALGNPLDLNHTVTRGIISGKSRYLGSGISLERLLQTDAVIQPGNSGGPLVNLDGKIVGINNAIASRTGMWQGTGFAIPSNDARRVSSQLIDKGRVSRGYLGVNMEDVRLGGAELAQKYGLKPNEGGVIIRNVVRNSPADVAGIHTDDVVVAVDDKKVETPDDMLQIISRKDVDTSVALSVLRVGEDNKPIQLTMNARLTERPDEKTLREIHRPGEANQTLPRVESAPDAEPASRFFGLEMEGYYDSATKTSGLMVNSVAPGSAADKAGLREGDVVTTLNGRSVRALSDFRAAMTTPVQGKQMLRYLRDGVSQLVVLEDE